jgi:hypothetical protein
MRSLDVSFRKLRVNLRKHAKEISEDVFGRFHPATRNVGDEICVFCNSTGNLTKEHVLPKWLIKNNAHDQFISSVNKRTASYNKAVIPTCSDCNNSVLAEIEKYIVEIVRNLDINNDINSEGICNVIRWMEILDYKLQIYDCRRKFLGFSEYEPDWATLPLSHMRHFLEMNPFRALTYLHKSHRRITVKSKLKRINSLAIFNTTQSHFDFFTQPDEYIYVSFPRNKIAMFYFLNREFQSHKEVCQEALYYIENVSQA